jgi:hypothetical protein
VYQQITGHHLAIAGNIHPVAQGEMTIAKHGGFRRFPNQSGSRNTSLYFAGLRLPFKHQI